MQVLYHGQKEGWPKMALQAVALLYHLRGQTKQAVRGGEGGEGVKSGPETFLPRIPHFSYIPRTGWVFSHTSLVGVGGGHVISSHHHFGRLMKVCKKRYGEIPELFHTKCIFKADILFSNFLFFLFFPDLNLFSLFKLLVICYCVNILCQPPSVTT